MSSNQNLFELGPSWHRPVYALGSVPLILFTLMGWEHQAYLTFGIAALICLILVVWPVRLGAAVLFWPFSILAGLYGGILVWDLGRLTTGGRPSVLLDADDTIVFLLVELIFLLTAALFLGMWKPKWFERLESRIGKG